MVAGSIPVYLNVYDLAPIHCYAYYVGLGAHHSGVEVHGVEYAFGAHDNPTTGIFRGQPKKCKGYTFRRSVLIGWTDLGGEEVRKVMETFAKDYKGNAYHIINKNCNHFCNDVCIKLTGNRIPGWVNRLSKVGFLCNCMIPMANDGKKATTKEIKKVDSNNTNDGNKEKIKENEEIESSSNDDGKKEKTDEVEKNESSSNDGNEKKLEEVEKIESSCPKNSEPSLSSDVVQSTSSIEVVVAPRSSSASSSSPLLQRSSNP